MLYIPVEASEGGGAVIIRKLNVPMFIPKDLNELMKALGSLRNDKEFAGVVLDSATEMVNQHVKPNGLGILPARIQLLAWLACQTDPTIRLWGS